MGTGINALQSILGRLKNNTKSGNMISVVTMHHDNLTHQPVIHWPDCDNLSPGVLAVPGVLSEDEWEAQFADEWESSFEDEWESQFADQ